MSRFNHWSKPQLLWAWHPCAGTTFSAGSALSRRAQMKSPRRNNNEERGQLSHGLGAWSMSCTIHALSWWPLFFLMRMIHQNIILQPWWFPNLSVSSSAPSCVFLLLRKMCKAVAGWGSDLGVVFPSFCCCHLPKKPFMSPLLPFVWAACHKSCCPTIPPPPQQKPPFATIILVWNPTLLGANNKKHPSCLRLWLQIFSPHQLPGSTESTPISALAGAPRGEIARARERHMFPITCLSLLRVLVTRDLTKQHWVERGHRWGRDSLLAGADPQEGTPWWIK